MLVIATPQTLEVRQMVGTARSLNLAQPQREEAALLEREHAGKVFVGESELARAMTRHVLAHVGGGVGPTP